MVCTGKFVYAILNILNKNLMKINLLNKLINSKYPETRLSPKRAFFRFWGIFYLLK